MCVVIKGLQLPIWLVYRLNTADRNHLKFDRTPSDPEFEGPRANSNRQLEAILLHYMPKYAPQ